MSQPQQQQKMPRIKKETKYNDVKHKYKKTSIGKKKLKTSSMNKHKRRRIGKNQLKLANVTTTTTTIYANSRRNKKN